MEVDNILQLVTADFAQAFADGVRPWDGKKAEGLNYRSNGEVYQCVNQFILMAKRMQKGFKSCNWLTFDEIRRIGGKINRHEKGTRVLFYSVEQSNGKTISVPRYKNVFNAEQTRGIKHKKDASKTANPYADASEFFKDLRFMYSHKGADAHYNRVADIIHLPAATEFESIEHYYTALARQLIHATGHRDRLDRIEKRGFNLVAEKLTGEIGASMLLSRLGLTFRSDPGDGSLLAAYRKLAVEAPALFIKAIKDADEAVEMVASMQAMNKSLAA